MSMTNRDRPSVAGSRVLPAFLAGFLAFGCLIVLAPPSAHAQDGDVRSLADQVTRLQRELNDLQRQVYSGGAANGPTGTAVGAGGSPLDARQEIRMQQLEAQLQELTGSVEQAAFGVRQLTDRLNKLIADVDFRLRAIEQQRGGTPMAQAPDADGTAAPSSDASAAASNPAVVAGAGPQTLGVLAQEQLDSLQNGQAPTQNQSAALSTAPANRGGGTPEEQYDYAFGLLRQANYAEAESALRGFIERHPNHELAGNAQYWLGETYYVRGDYTQAAVAFAEGYQQYPEGSKAADNLLKLGMSLAEIGQTDDACRAFLELSRQFPDAPSNLKERATREGQRNGCS
ncbi:tol-pal system protein YbgF [Rhodospirillaceae bacterium SYSU D60014]|uniref:tol-pal system protein YbgF n=1 Tax=Virgifigura deserti TaxID=2268457 RepID=UPI000E670D29